MDKIQPYLINGVFFQPGIGFGIGYGAEGIRAKLIELVRHNFFAGVFNFQEPNSTRDGVGQMTDNFGESELSAITLTATHFTFTKRYSHRGDTILYTFDKKKGDIWIGKFEGEKTGEGVVKCQVIKSTEELFMDPDSQH